jgi:hypothetical protein
VRNPSAEREDWQCHRQGAPELAEERRRQEAQGDMTDKPTVSCRMSAPAQMTRRLKLTAERQMLSTNSV